MKPNKALRVPEYLQHIVAAIDRATGYVAGMNVSTFEGDSRTQDAVIRSTSRPCTVGPDVRHAQSHRARLFRDRPCRRLANRATGFADASATCLRIN